MKLRKIAFITLCLVTCFLSCNKDDDGETIEPVPVRDRAEQQVADKAVLLDYLATHYYNSSAFEAIEHPTIKDIVITKLPEGTTTAPDGNTLLKDATNLETISINFADIEYEYYLLKLKQGTGTESPEFADNVLIVHEGRYVSNTVFDSAINPITFDLTGEMPGWGKVFPLFNVSKDFIENTDGTVSFRGQGIGVMFLPSGLAYFASPPFGSTIPQYSPLIYKFELLQTTQNDHDNDGIPSYLEDVDGDGNLFDENTDNDLEINGFTPKFNFVDSDDDGDGILTINEDIDGDGDPTNDIGKNGIPKYLDPEETESKLNK
ncbi:FKBP-type peptidyl-prolyl cis-trans isomerase [Flavivirga eckloniae]|nr:peptidylprolyl isomerase [Flavivirga eckloniae]